MIITILLILFFAYICLIRNAQVFFFHRRLLDEIRNYQLSLTNAGNNSVENIDQAYEVYDSSSYDEKILKFWRFLEGFYTEEQYIKMIGRKSL